MKRKFLFLSNLIVLFNMLKKDLAVDADDVSKVFEEDYSVGDWDVDNGDVDLTL